MFHFKNACEKFQDEVVAFGLSKESEHLQKCAECHDFIAFFHDVRLSTKNLPDLTINPHVLTRLQSMAYEHVLKKQYRSWSFMTDWMAKLTPAMVVLILFMGLGYVMGAHDNGVIVAQNGVQSQSEVSNLGYPELSVPNQMVATNYLKPVSLSQNGPSLSLDSDNAALNSGNAFEKQLEEYRKLTMESDADTLLMRGRRLKAMGKVDQALKDFENIMAFYPNYTYLGDVLMYRAQCYAILGKFDEAINSLETYLEKNPSKRALIEPMINQISETRDDGQVLVN